MSKGLGPSNVLPSCVCWSRYFGSEINLDATGEHAFKRQLYLCMLAQAIEMKADIETRRASNTFGTWTWQLNEIW